MEVHKFTCDCCGKELNEKKIVISQKYTGRRYDGLCEEYENYTVNNQYHLCPECWESVKKLVIKH